MVYKPTHGSLNHSEINMILDWIVFLIWGSDIEDILYALKNFQYCAPISQQCVAVQW